MRILVTGGTGTLGRQIVQQLASSSHQVSVLSRRRRLPPDFPAFDLRTADLVTGEDLGAALDGIEGVIHCATNPKDLRATVDVRGTSNLIAAAKGTSAHLTYISIVGCDEIPVPYYKAKHRGEQLIEGSGLSWSILRATQFHDLLFQVLGACAKPPVAVIPKGFQFQPVSSGEVAAHLITTTQERLAGRRPDFGGPQRADIAHWMRLILGSRGKRVVDVPVPGRIGKGFRMGRNTVIAGDLGTATFEQFLATR